MAACSGAGGTADATTFCSERLAASCGRELRKGRLDEPTHALCVMAASMTGCLTPPWPEDCDPPYPLIDRCLDAIEDPANDGPEMLQDIAECTEATLCPSP